MKEKTLLLFLLILLAFPFSASAFSFEKSLSEWTETAKAADAEFLSVSTEKIPDGNVICERSGEAELRLLSFAGAISDNGMHPVYLIAKGDFYPTGTCLTSSYGNGILYSHDVLDEIEAGGEKFTVHRFILFRKFSALEDGGRNCLHAYTENASRDASCLVRGVTKVKCGQCGDIKITYHAPLGHIDTDCDSVCDRCGYRVFEETVGQNITSTVKVNGTDYTLNWTLVDDAYQGGCLYIADSGIPASEMGGYGSGKTYENTPAFDWLSNVFSNESSIKGDILMFLDDDGTTGYAQMLSQKTAETYRPLMAAGDYVTHTANGKDLIVVHDDGTTGTVSADSDVSVRLAMLLSEPIKTEASLAHWNVGDRVTRTIDGVEYGFTCVDENYSDIYGNHTFSALFLMDDVIPAGYGGEYKWEVDSTGHSVQVWHPGPVANFGDSNNYKYSNIRAFLDAETVFTAADVVVGPPNAYTGATADNKFGQTDNTGLSAYTIGYQQMTARLFILSVEEALKYRQYLWRFNSSTDNPASAANSTCGAYWLRTPNGTNRDYYDTGMCYCVDLLKGNIHPEYIKPAGGTGDSYVDTQTTVGIRPAFTLPNR